MAIIGESTGQMWAFLQIKCELLVNLLLWLGGASRERRIQPRHLLITCELVCVELRCRQHVFQTFQSFLLLCATTLERLCSSFKCAATHHKCWMEGHELISLHFYLRRRCVLHFSLVFQALQIFSGSRSFLWTNSDLEVQDAYILSFEHPPNIPTSKIFSIDGPTLFFVRNMRTCIPGRWADMLEQHTRNFL